MEPSDRSLEFLVVLEISELFPADDKLAFTSLDVCWRVDDDLDLRASGFVTLEILRRSEPLELGGVDCVTLECLCRPEPCELGGVDCVTWEFLCRPEPWELGGVDCVGGGDGISSRKI